MAPKDKAKTNSASEWCTLCIELGVRQEDLAHIQGSVRSFGVPWRTPKNPHITRVLQGNMNRSKIPDALVYQLAHEGKADLLFLSEQYRDRESPISLIFSVSRLCECWTRGRCKRKVMDKEGDSFG